MLDLDKLYIHDILGDAVRIYIAVKGSDTKTKTGNINISKILIKDVTNTTSYGKGLGIANGKKVNISNVDVYNVKKEGVWIGYISECNISNILVDTARHCGVMCSYTSDHINIDNVVSTNCSADAVGGGISINNASHINLSNHVSIQDQRDSICLTEWFDYVQVTNCQSYEPKGSGIKIEQLTADAGVLKIDNCIVVDPNQSGSAHGCGVYNADTTYNVDEVWVTNTRFFADAGVTPEYDIKTKSGDGLVYVSSCKSDPAFYFDEFSGVAGTKIFIINNPDFNPVGSVGPPSVPATTVNYTNAYGYPCQVQVYGGTVTEIAIDDIATGLTSGIFMIPPGGTINITYSAAPSWRWWGL